MRFVKSQSSQRTIAPGWQPGPLASSRNTGSRKKSRAIRRRHRRSSFDLLSREAKARGTNRTGLITQISAEAVAYRQIALLVGALEAEASAAIDAVPDDAANVEDLIATVLITAREQADTAYSDALTILKGAK